MDICIDTLHTLLFKKLELEPESKLKRQTLKLLMKVLSALFKELNGNSRSEGHLHNPKCKALIKKWVFYLLNAIPKTDAA